jgi:16S rRNA (guanine527-N7)-methyltransferase
VRDNRTRASGVVVRIWRCGRSGFSPVVPDIPVGVRGDGGCSGGWTPELYAAAFRLACTSVPISRNRMEREPCPSVWYQSGVAEPERKAEESLMLNDRTEAKLRRLERAYLEAVERGFLGPHEGKRLRERHIDDALALATVRSPVASERWVDLGSGAGLPGLPLAVAFPATSFTLVDAHRRRVDWIAATAVALGVTNVEAVHARLEDFGRGAGREHFDVATARALGPLPVVAELGVPVLRVGGTLLVPRGVPSDAEMEQLARACERLGAEVREVIPNPSSPIDQVGSVVIMAKIAATSPGFPRRSGVPARSPLGGG